MTIPLEDIEQFLAQGWLNTTALDLSRLIQPGQTVTIVLSDGPFAVPGQINGANVLASRQKEFNNPGLLKVRVVERI